MKNYETYAIPHGFNDGCFKQKKNKNKFVQKHLGHRGGGGGDRTGRSKKTFSHVCTEASVNKHSIRQLKWVKSIPVWFCQILITLTYFFLKLKLSKSIPLCLYHFLVIHIYFFVAYRHIQSMSIPIKSGYRQTVKNIIQHFIRVNTICKDEK